ncbi:MAG: ATP-dependent helicase C-terminal domain-containing protein [bacterium]|nr:ATP-dependent helicase C-terminal domain-containing protein [bacterium]
MTARVTLPVDSHLEAIAEGLGRSGCLVLVAPPGTGKSTRVPPALLARGGSWVVLQPRRLAARALAKHVAREAGEALGETVGFRVRFEQVVSPRTRLTFETTGTFWQRLLREPHLPGLRGVVLDEFHERSLEADAVLAWLRHLRRTTRPDLELVVMSATLEHGAIARYLDDAPVLEVETAVYPVAIAHQAPHPHEPVWEQAARGVRHVWSELSDGSVLVFLPGQREIARSMDALGSWARERGLALHALHGAMPLADQLATIEAPARGRCVVLATNVAETSLTLPGIVAVVDSGLVREGRHDAGRDLDVLELGLVSRASATQRAGRAGRLGPGRCLRLWDRTLETSMAEHPAPEIARLDPTRLALAVAHLGFEPTWFEAPPSDRWQLAHERLVTLGALEAGGGLTDTGRRLLEWPLPPILGRVLLAARKAGQATVTAAMIALLEGTEAREERLQGDLLEVGLELASRPDDRAWPREVRETYRQLLRLVRPSDADHEAACALYVPDSPGAITRREAVTRAWMSGLGHRLGVRQERAYALPDGTHGMLATRIMGEAPGLLLALDVQEVRGGARRQVQIRRFLPVPPHLVEGARTETLLTRWDPARARVVQEREVRLNDVVIARETVPPDRWDRQALEAELVARTLSGEARLEALEDDEVVQWIRRIRRAHAAWPEDGYPALDADDLELLCLEAAAGRTGWQDLEPAMVVEILKGFLGWAKTDRLERAAPRHWPLPGGRRARVTYPDEGPPEVSARLGDMVGLEGTLSLYEGRVPVVFDILAPNYRTVQKTSDMSRFWRDTYPEVKKELRRRYPKHPWP